MRISGTLVEEKDYNDDVIDVEFEDITDKVNKNTMRTSGSLSEDNQDYSDEQETEVVKPSVRTSGTLSEKNDDFEEKTDDIDVSSYNIDNLPPGYEKVGTPENFAITFPPDSSPYYNHELHLKILQNQEIRKHFLVDGSKPWGRGEEDKYVFRAPDGFVWDETKDKSEYISVEGHYLKRRGSRPNPDAKIGEYGYMPYNTSHNRDRINELINIPELKARHPEYLTLPDVDIFYVEAESNPDRRAYFCDLFRNQNRPRYIEDINRIDRATERVDVSDLEFDANTGTLEEYYSIRQEITRRINDRISAEGIKIEDNYEDYDDYLTCVNEIKKIVPLVDEEIFQELGKFAAENQNVKFSPTSQTEIVINGEDTKSIDKEFIRHFSDPADVIIGQAAYNYFIEKHLSSEDDLLFNIDSSQFPPEHPETLKLFDTYKNQWERLIRNYALTVDRADTFYLEGQKVYSTRDIEGMKMLAHYQSVMENYPYIKEEDHARVINEIDDAYAIVKRKQLHPSEIAVYKSYLPEVERNRELRPNYMLCNFDVLESEIRKAYALSDDETYKSQILNRLLSICWRHDKGINPSKQSFRNNLVPGYVDGKPTVDYNFHEHNRSPIVWRNELGRDVANGIIRENLDTYFETLSPKERFIFDRTVSEMKRDGIEWNRNTNYAKDSSEEAWNAELERLMKKEGFDPNRPYPLPSEVQKITTDKKNGQNSTPNSTSKTPENKTGSGFGHKDTKTSQNPNEPPKNSNLGKSNPYTQPPQTQQVYGNGFANLFSGVGNLIGNSARGIGDGVSKVSTAWKNNTEQRQDRIINTLQSQMNSNIQKADGILDDFIATSEIVQNKVMSNPNTKKIVESIDKFAKDKGMNYNDALKMMRKDPIFSQKMDQVIEKEGMKGDFNLLNKLKQKYEHTTKQIKDQAKVLKKNGYPLDPLMESFAERHENKIKEIKDSKLSEITEKMKEMIQKMVESLIALLKKITGIKM